MTIRVGVLLDSMTVPLWQKRILEHIKNNSLFSIQLIVLNATPPRSSGFWLYKTFRKIDRALFKTKHDCFQRVEVVTLLQDCTIRTCKPILSTFTDELTSDDIDAINNSNLDVLIRFGFRILKGEILTAAKYGVWSLHHGDNSINRGGPPAFWEVVNNEHVTGVTLQVLSNDLDGGIVLDKAFVRTDRTSFNRNQNALYWSGVELFCNALNQLAKNAGPVAAPFSSQVMGAPAQGRGLGEFYSKPLYRNPTNLQALSIFTSFWMRRVKEGVASILKKQQWSWFYKFSPGKTETSLFRYRQLTPPSGTDWADPFIVWKNQKYYVFFEELVHPTKRGHISCFEFDNTGRLETNVPVKILNEPWHLSYPFILEHENIFYMIPEAAENNNVWMYKCDQFPDQWRKHKLLLKDTALFDPTLIFHQDVWYIFGTQKPFGGSSPDQYLYIYFSRNLFSDTWQAHPQNPVTRDVRGARPAGRIFEQDGKLIRPSQLGAPKYGYGIRFHEIVKLTPEEFEEQMLTDILPDWKTGLLATHTFNAANGFSVVDAQM